MNQQFKWKFFLGSIFIMLMVVIACAKKNEGPVHSPPADHTISQDGFMHKPGLNDPLNNCTNCHGADLRGGTTGVSCYECHGQKW